MSQMNVADEVDPDELSELQSELANFDKRVSEVTKNISQAEKQYVKTYNSSRMNESPFEFEFHNIIMYYCTLFTPWNWAFVNIIDLA